MKSRARVLAALDKRPFDRLPIKHLAVAEIDKRLREHFGVQDADDLFLRLGHDFREIRPAYCGPLAIDEGSDCEHGIISGIVWSYAMSSSANRTGLTLANMTNPSDVGRLAHPTTNWYDYSSIREQCLKYTDYARIFGYCEGDFINGVGFLRGVEQVLIDIGTRDSVYMAIVERRFQFVYEHIQQGLEAGGGHIEFVHFGEDLGSQQGLLFSRQTFAEIFAEKYRQLFALAHAHGARTMLHVCGSVREIIPDLISLGLDVLDVVQTNAAGMNLLELKNQFGKRLAFAGTMCVQKVLPFGTPEQVCAEVKKRVELFHDGGLIIGPSHQIQTDTPLANILAMYRAAGGLNV